ncbi:uncharacterized protein [Euphorbia lathyris]|uniref:uncharacterized protein n=1 Tax=Euphorbia lathyris TaxID=212925 RepID=UPI003313C019
MCSNTSLSSSGGGSGGDNEGYGGGDSIYSKKQRRQKVPKRGPGVAELEKILREQEKTPSMSSSSSYRLQSLALPSSSSSVSAVSPSPRGKSGVHMWNSNSNSNCDSRFQFSAFPQLNGSTSTSTTQLFHSSGSNLMNTTTRQHSPPSTKNLFPHPGNGMSSSLTTLSAGNCHGREPPSSQTSFRHSTLWPEEDKMVGEKRARPFSMEIPPVPPFRYHIPTFPAQMNRLDAPFSCDSRTLFNFEPTDHAMSRETRHTTYMEPNSKKPHIEHGETEGNFLIFPSPNFPSPNTPPSLIHTPNIFNPFPFQESNTELQHNWGISHQGGAITKKPFYSFLPPREKLGIAESLNTERVETRGDAIDLDLRL